MNTVGADVADLSAASKWACNNGKYQRQPISMQKQCKRETARAMRQARHIDPQGREVRSKHPVIIPYEGEQLVLWVDIRTANPDQMKSSLTSGWKAIGNDVKRHAIDPHFI